MIYSLQCLSGSTIRTLLHDKINPKDCQVLSLGDSRFLQFLRVVSSDYGKPRLLMKEIMHHLGCKTTGAGIFLSTVVGILAEKLPFLLNYSSLCVSGLPKCSPPKTNECALKNSGWKTSLSF